jgi:hypothetical protein
MLYFNKNSIIYVLCPSKWVTWWPEAIHQLVYKLHNSWFLAFICYMQEIDNPMPEIYKKYYPWINYVYYKDVNDNKSNILIVPEIYISKLIKFNNIQKSIWWLSVDNWEKIISPMINYFFNNILKLIKNNFFNKVTDFIYSKILNIFWKINFPLDKKIVHLCQSKYSEKWILDKKGKHIIFPLSDYLNNEFLIDTWFNIELKENIIVYNPKKWIHFTRKLISKFWKLHKFVPIINMTTIEVQNLLKKSKIYIDFWNHPWKDRLPRESALQWCCILTNTEWSANFFSDIPIKDDYVFDKFILNEINAKIINIFDNYDKCIHDFEYYIWQINNQETIFENEIKNIFINTDLIF